MSDQQSKTKDIQFTIIEENEQIFTNYKLEPLIPLAVFA